MSKLDGYEALISLMFPPNRSRLDFVWSSNENSKDDFSFQSPTQQMLAPGLMFSNPLAKNNSKSQQQPK